MMDTTENLGQEFSQEVPVHARSLEKASVTDLALSSLLWGAGVSFLVPSLGAMTALFSVVPSHRVNFLGRWYCRAQLALTGNRWRSVVHPAIDPNRQYIFAQNHTNHFDHVVMYNATPHFKQGLELASHFDYPFYGWFMKARGTIPVEKGRQRQTGQVEALMQREIDEGRSILAFPEGTRTTDGRVGRFRKGIFYIARNLGVPIVPVTVTGSYDMMRKGSYVIRPGNTLTVYCDAPVETAGVTEEEIETLMTRVRAPMVERMDAYWRAQEEKRGSR